MNKSTSPMTAVVLGVDSAGRDRTVMSNGRATRILDGIPGHALTGAGTFLTGCANLFAGGRDGTVITRHVPAAPWGAADGTPTEQLGRFLQDARAAGWHCTNAALDHGSGWVTFTRDDTPTIHLGVCAAMPEASQPLFDPAWTAEQICRQLAVYAAAVGVPYRTTPGITGCEVIRRYHETKAPGRNGFRPMPTWVWPNGVVMRDITTPGEILWNRKPTVAEAACRWVHVFDVSKQFLAAMAAAELSWPAPEHTGAEIFDPGRAGIWQILLPAAERRVGAKTKALPPLLNLAKIAPNGMVWVTTPVGALLTRMGVPFEVFDSWTAPRVRHTSSDGREIPGTGRWLREPAEKLRDALAMHGRPAGHKGLCFCAQCRLVTTMKATGNGAVGMLAAPNSALRRPDVAATIRDLARVLLLMKLYRAYKDHKISPVRVVHDAVYFTSDSPDHREIGAQIGAVSNGQIGRFRWDRTIPMDVFKAEHLQNTRRPGRPRNRSARAASATVGAEQ